MSDFDLEGNTPEIRKHCQISVSQPGKWDQSACMNTWPNAQNIHSTGVVDREFKENIGRTTKSVEIGDLFALYGTWEALGVYKMLPRGVGAISRHFLEIKTTTNKIVKYPIRFVYFLVEAHS